MTDQTWSSLPSPAGAVGEPRNFAAPFVVLGIVLSFLRFGVDGLLVSSLLSSLAFQAHLLSKRFRMAAGHAVQRVSHVSGLVATTALLGAVYWLAIVPVSLARRLVLGATQDADSAPGWVIRQRVPHTKRTYSSERDQRVARHATALGHDHKALPRRAALGVLSVGIALGLVAPTAVDSLRSAESAVVAGSGFDPFATAALAEQPMRDQGAAEFGEAFMRLTPTPFVGFSLPDYEGTVVNIENRMRRSYEPGFDDADDPTDVWFFGGSVMFGYAMQRDLHTIPSEFARIAEADGTPVRVRNYGSIGYVNYQETLLLAMLLGVEEAPDLVVFYDGYNDKGLQVGGEFGLLGRSGEPSHIFFEAFASSVAEVRQATDLPSGSLRTEALDEGSGTGDAESAVDNLVEVYGQGIDLSRSLADSYGFDVAHYWHPDVYTKRLVEGETDIADGQGISAFQLQIWRALSREIAGSLPEGVVDVSDAFDDLDDPVLSSATHTNELGARHMAEVLFADLKDRLGEPEASQNG